MFKRRLKTQNGFLLAAPAVLDLIFLLQIFFLIGDKVVVQEGITVSFPNTQEQEVETVADKIDAGARVIAVDTVAEKFEACREAGASECVDAGAGDVIEALMEFTGGKGVDVAIDYVSATATLSQAFASLGVRGRMVTLGGSGETFEADAMQLLVKELDVLGSRYVTKFEVHQALELVARGEVWPLVSEIRAMEEAETIHALVEQGGITGRAAILIG